MTETNTNSKNDSKTRDATGASSTGVKYEIDATGRKVGRLATEIAHILMGKNMPDFEKHVVADVEVTVTNVSKIDLPQRKADGKIYTRYTGFPGGLRKESAAKLAARRGHSELLKRAVYGMLPGNRLRKPRMKRLTITE
ncbi:50S ribosomal protein L13 [Candidatus Kaiserbacteria bacterium CG10_big_fil_rev_8_21_14_0_10_49_17]|uniref:Large ribosomal subunit protein uL13 n=1 Tax=Candidatus Kaiserbacteria bacterium CG10_big_fil_rev_8_21_14_0_10_49_17 TaxID=1974609 RepID=A0A2M6WF88_9BACT|nr:MAG: 50S ribosomal protein L13 [Candidatus Kaiserbacteria bacterium CG10_big_fil_rev_8_21_14_0_10_49_17]